MVIANMAQEIIIYSQLLSWQDNEGWKTSSVGKLRSLWILISKKPSNQRKCFTGIAAASKSVFMPDLIGGYDNYLWGPGYSKSCPICTLQDHKRLENFVQTSAFF